MVPCIQLAVYSRGGVALYVMLPTLVRRGSLPCRVGQRMGMYGTTEQLVHGGWCHAAVVDASQMHTVPMKWCCARARIATSRTEHLPIKDGRAIYRCCYVRGGCVTTQSVCVCYSFCDVWGPRCINIYNGVAPHHHARMLTIMDCLAC
jgi:hypothetical protein